MSEIDKAIGIMNDLKPIFFYDGIMDTHNVIIQALEEKQQREQGCEYCNNGKEIESTFDITKYSWGYELTGYSENGTTRGCEINYCPMCGRRLSHE